MLLQVGKLRRMVLRCPFLGSGGLEMPLRRGKAGSGFRTWFEGFDIGRLR